MIFLHVRCETPVERRWDGELALSWGRGRRAGSIQPQAGSQSNPVRIDAQYPKPKTIVSALETKAPFVEMRKST
jgi:hypothetical protein